MTKPRVHLVMPSYGDLTAAAAAGFYCAASDRLEVDRLHSSGSLLAQNFNALWCSALNKVHRGGKVDYFAMQHADVEPERGWLDLLIDELESKNLDILGAVVPIKSVNGLTSLALARADGDNWRPQCRLTMDEVYRLPDTFTSEDVGAPLLLNTGLWVCRFDLAWALKVRFTINDRIVFDQCRDMYCAEVEPEDWYFSRLCHELGLRVGATRKVSLEHAGRHSFTNTHAWGLNQFDSEYVPASTIPEQTRATARIPLEV